MNLLKHWVGSKFIIEKYRMIQCLKFSSKIDKKLILEGAGIIKLHLDHESGIFI